MRAEHAPNTQGSTWLRWLNAVRRGRMRCGERAYHVAMPGSLAHIDLLVTSRGNARVKQLRAAFADAGRHCPGELVAIEGEHLLQEALRSGLRLEMVFASEHRAVPAWVPVETPRLRLAEAVFASAVETRSPQGLAALVAPPNFGIDDVTRAATPLVLIAAGLQDPGNLGTLIRSAEAFGASGVLLTPGTVSAWNGKAVRASVGSVFRLPVVACGADEVRALRERGLALLAAVGAVAGQTLEIGEVDLARPVALMVGHEGGGLAAEWIALAEARVTIPCPGPVESLNAAVAASVMLYEASRQRAESARATPRGRT